MSKVLLIGSRQNKFDPTDTGGVTILFELLIYEFQKRNIDFKVIDTLGANNGGKFKTFFSTYYNIIKNIHKYNYISLHATANTFLYLAPTLILLSKVLNKQVSIRMFAGHFGDVYKTSSGFRKALARFVLKNADSIFFELEHLVKEFKKYNSNTFWFPNVRSEDIQIDINRKFHKRFVYIGSVNKEKGIDDLCDAIIKLDDDSICDIYGPCKYENEKYSVEYFKKIGVNYKGSLTADEVQKTMINYDVLVLPSYREGYPGVIIEAFSQGMPVIATKLPGILEMCKDDENTILIDIGEPKQILAAMKSFDDEKYERLHQGAKKAFLNFNSNIQTDLFLKRIGYSKSKDKV